MTNRAKNKGVKSLWLYILPHPEPRVDRQIFSEIPLAWIAKHLCLFIYMYILLCWSNKVVCIHAVALRPFCPCIMMPSLTDRCLSISNRVTAGLRIRRLSQLGWVLPSSLPPCGRHEQPADTKPIPSLLLPDSPQGPGSQAPTVPVSLAATGGCATQF